MIPPPMTMAMGTATLVARPADFQTYFGHLLTVGSPYYGVPQMRDGNLLAYIYGLRFRPFFHGVMY